VHVVSFDAAVASTVSAACCVAAGYIVCCCCLLCFCCYSILLLREDLSRNLELTESKPMVSAGSSSSVSAGYIIEFMLEDLEAVPADYVPAGHVLISADRYRIC
ncbi:hypothetical protein Tco_0736122, partial [Tanacetum coccineum]